MKKAISKKRKDMYYDGYILIKDALDDCIEVIFKEINKLQISILNNLKNTNEVYWQVSTDTNTFDKSEILPEVLSLEEMVLDLINKNE